MQAGVVIEREFNFHGVKLPDPDPKLSPEEVKGVFCTIYPDIVTTSITGPEPVGNKLVYHLVHAVGAKG